MKIMSTKNTKNAAHAAIAEGSNIQNTIRDIVTQALEDGKMEPEAIKQTLNQVIEGACEGTKIKPQENAEILKEVVNGVDNALKQASIASKLAIEEASGNIQDFSDHDLKRALNDLQDLERLFFDTLSEVASQGKETVYDTLKGLLNHMQSSGSSVGQSVNEIVAGLHSDLSEGGRLQKIQAADVAKATGATVASIASGVLAGIADSLQTKDK